MRENGLKGDDANQIKPGWSQTWLDHSVNSILFKKLFNKSLEPLPQIDKEDLYGLKMDRCV